MSKNAFAVLILLIATHINSVAGIGFDSIGIEKKGGKTYVIHRVEAKETLYSISRKYSVTVDEIKSANEGLTTDLKIGQNVLVPSRYTEQVKTAKAGTHTVEKGETLYSISRAYKITVGDLKKANPEITASDIQPGQVLVIPGAEDETASAKGESLTHTVSAKETFYSISRKYSVTIQDLKNANPEVDELKIGQVIVIPGKTKSKDSVKEIRVEKKDPDKEETKSYVEVKKPSNTVAPVNMPALNNLKKDSYTKVNESGMIEVYQDNSGFHYALHKTAPVGTVIFLENEETGQKVFVRVMGKLTEAAPGVIMKISPVAFDKIAKGGTKVKVNASYIP